MNEQLFTQPKPRPNFTKLTYTITVTTTLALVTYGELHADEIRKSLKPTFTVGTPWGTMQILTPWGHSRELPNIITTTGVTPVSTTSTNDAMGKAQREAINKELTERHEQAKKEAFEQMARENQAKVRKCVINGETIFQDHPCETQ